MEDIAPQLLAHLKQQFSDVMEEDSVLQELLKLIEQGGGDYDDAAELAYRVGDALAHVFGAGLSSSVLPDGKMYWNIADRVVRELLEREHGIVAEAAALVQESLNRQAGIGLAVQRVPVDKEKVDGMLNSICAAEQYDDAAEMLQEPVRLYSQKIVDESIRRNVEFHGRAGLKPRIVRRSTWRGCKWCRAMAGTYSYPNVPRDVYRRHENCRCSLTYSPADGSKATLWTQGDAAQQRKQKEPAQRATD